MYTRDQLAREFRGLGIQVGDTVMLHASVRAVGPVAGGPDQIHLALKDALTPEGTLLMYASCPQYYDEVGRGNLSPQEELDVLETLPAFDPLTARSARDNGALVEMLRTYPGSIVNRHVARFVAWGAKADHLFCEQPWNYAFGAGSAIERFLHLDGKIVLLGSDHDAVTFLHYVEHVAEFPDKRIARFRVPVQQGCKRVWVPMEEFDTSERAHANWPDDFFRQIVDGYLEQSGNAGGRAGDAPTFVMSARGLFDYASKIMIQVAAQK